MTNLFKRFFTHKSKFLLIILCLLGMVFSYSCSCRNDSTNPNTPPPTPDGKKNFSPNVDVQSSILRVKGDSSIYGNSQIIIKFGEDNNADFTVSIDSVEDTDSTEKLTLDTSDYKRFNKSTGKFELTSGGLEKVANLKTDTKPADKKLK